MDVTPRGMQRHTRPSIAWHKGVKSIMAQRVRKPYRGLKNPSSVTQLPILTALHAGSLLC